jgi:ABC-2 type transport system ATP-binding protein
MITVDGLTKAYGSLRAVDRISFRVERGELFGLLGPNGAGKTTTVSMISGLLRPDEGAVFIGEYNLWESPRAAKRLLGLVPQEPAIYEELNARENLLFWGGLYGLGRVELKRNCDQLLDRVGLGGRTGEPVGRYSGGMKRRLNLAIGLVHEPKVLLLDEPTVGIDPPARNNILEIIRDIARQGTTIIFTTHHLEEAEKLCDRIAIMDHGRILQTGSVAELAKVAGDHDVVTLRGKFTASQLQQCLAGAPVSAMSVADALATVHLTSEAYGISRLVTDLSHGGVELTDLSVQKPTLESVFLKLTGRELRD